MMNAPYSPPSRCASPTGQCGSGRGAGRTAPRRTRRCIFPAGRNHAGRCIEHTVHGAGMDAVKVDAVLVVAGVDEVDADPVALPRANGRAGNAPVVRPGQILQPRDDLDRVVQGDQPVLAQGLPVRQHADRTAIEIGQRGCWVKPVPGVIDLPYDHRHRKNTRRIHFMSRMIRRGRRCSGGWCRLGHGQHLAANRPEPTCGPRCHQSAPVH